MKTKKTLKFSKETIVILDNKSKQTIIGGQLQKAGNETVKWYSCIRLCLG
ncbi:hypothetical protein QWZ06_12105 [Chryseobacterium tructae]|uniref:Bacteriocin n=1 Tax=Chryseobacterium tructae TaxID=1037380 RepID=A0ABV7XXH5_9FLAO|nr:hypothetical protein [Chryseobacterium tructae]MDN3692971.1 hypothetical protein [Chryseobacterium tructae]